MNPEEPHDEKVRESVDQKFGTKVLIGFSLLIIIAFASYFFNTELTDLT